MHTSALQNIVSCTRPTRTICCYFLWHSVAIAKKQNRGVQICRICVNANDNNNDYNDEIDHFTPCAIARGKNDNWWNVHLSLFMLLLHFVSKKQNRGGSVDFGAQIPKKKRKIYNSNMFNIVLNNISYARRHPSSRCTKLLLRSTILLRTHPAGRPATVSRPLNGSPVVSTIAATRGMY